MHEQPRGLRGGARLRCARPSGWSPASPACTAAATATAPRTARPSRWSSASAASRPRAGRRCSPPRNSGSAACCSPAPTARRSATFAEETVGELVREHSKADLLTTLCLLLRQHGQHPRLGRGARRPREHDPLPALADRGADRPGGDARSRRPAARPALAARPAAAGPAAGRDARARPPVAAPRPSWRWSTPSPERAHEPQRRLGESRERAGKPRSWAIGACLSSQGVRGAPPGSRERPRSHGARGRRGRWRARRSRRRSPTPASRPARSTAWRSPPPTPTFDLGCFDVLGRDRRPYRCRCGLGAVALHSAWNAVSAGASDVVVCVGHDAGAERRRRGAAEIETQAAAAREYMQHSGATEQHLARVAAKNRRHGAANPHALLSTAVGADEVLASEMLVWPLRRLMVADAGPGRGRGRPRLPRGRPAPRPEGAARARLGPARRGLQRRRLGRPRRPPRLLLRRARPGGRSTSPRSRTRPRSTSSPPTRRSSSPPTAPAPNSSTAASPPSAASSRSTPAAARSPRATSRGAGGILQLVELSLQLRDRAGPRQVPGARVGLGLAGSRHRPRQGHRDDHPQHLTRLRRRLQRWATRTRGACERHKGAAANCARRRGRVQSWAGGCTGR